MLTTRPLLPKEPQGNDRFRHDVFDAHGSVCFFVGYAKVLDTMTGRQRVRRPHERCRKFATDPMHVVPRSQLGSKSRYACGAANGRPGCRTCHDLQGAHMLEFPDRVYNRAVDALLRAYPRLSLRRR